MDEYELTPELLAFEAKLKEAFAKDHDIDGSSGLLQYPLQVFFAVLQKRYGNSLNTFVQKAASAGENVRLSEALLEVFQQRAWSIASSRKYATNLRRILKYLQLPEGFVDSLRLVSTAKPPPNRALGKFSKHEEEDPARKLVESWVEVIRDETRCRSDLSVNNIIRFWCNACVPKLGLSLDEWPKDVSTAIQKHLLEHPDSLKELVGDGKDAHLKRQRVQLFLKHCAGMDNVELPKVKRRVETAPDSDDDGGDVHKFSPEELERLQEEAKKDLRDELFFMLMLTTGLRVGGVAHILTKSVADVKQGQYVVRGSGKTKEKCHKMAHFVLCASVRSLVHSWLTRGRPAIESPYLFPGMASGTHISTETIRARFADVCKRAGIEGPQCHPHSLRHTHAHMLLECGNSVEAVSKCLNHSSVKVTQQHYLKESAAEVAARCNVPWVKPMSEQEKQEKALASLPSFLMPAKETNESDKHQAKRQRRELNQQRLKDFSGRM